VEGARADDEPDAPADVDGVLAELALPVAESTVLCVAEVVVLSLGCGDRVRRGYGVAVGVREPLELSRCVLIDDQEAGLAAVDRDVAGWPLNRWAMLAGAICPPAWPPRPAARRYRAFAAAAVGPVLAGLTGVPTTGTAPQSDFAVATLLAWQLRQAEEVEAAREAWQTQGHVFTMEDGRPLDPSYLTRLFQKLRRGSGEELPPLTFHGLRHCHASLMLASGADLAVVSKLLGHKSITITADIYGHLIGTLHQTW
jgi:hypothetical protein